MTVGDGESPIYANIASLLRDQIRSGELAPGAQVPTERELSEQHNASRNTVRAALNQLATEGLITSGRGRAGRFVRIRNRLVWTHDVEADASKQGLDAFAEQAARLGRNPEEDVDVRIVAAIEEYASLLHVEPRSRLVLRKRIRMLDGQPSQISEGYYPLDLFEDKTDLLTIMQPGDIQGGVIAFLARIGYRQSHVRDEVLARMPDPVEADELDIGVGVPVLVNQRVGYTGDRPVRLVRTIMPGDRHKLRYDLPV